MMLSRIQVLFFSRIAVLLYCGTALPLCAGQTKAVFPVKSERLFLCPITDSSALGAIDGWPADSHTRTILTTNFITLHNNLFVELRRCEKFGLYEMSDDSVRAGIRVSITLLPCAVRGDSLLVPVRISASNPIAHSAYDTLISASGVYRAKSPAKSRLHFLNALVADFRRTFPVETVARLFYPTRGAK
jgi:hypothetical protein